MNTLYQRDNDAVRDNPPFANGRAADIHITEHGSSFYYAVMSFTGFMGLVLIAASLSKRRTDRLFFYLLAGANIVASISYYAMGSNLGFTPVAVQFYRNDSDVRGEFRQVFWTRYVDWFVTTPLLLLSMLLTAGVPAPTLLFTIFMNEVMIICGLVGAVTQGNSYRWGFFAFGCAAMFYVLWILIWQGRKYAKHLGNDIHRVYLISVVWQMIIWICYPICWGVSEGGNMIAPDSEAVYYGVLDMLAKPFYAMMFLFFHRKIDPGRLGLKFRDYDEDFRYYHWRNEENGRLHHPEPKDETPAEKSTEGVHVPNTSEHGHNNNTTTAPTNGQNPAAANTTAA